MSKSKKSTDESTATKKGKAKKKNKVVEETVVEEEVDVVTGEAVEEESDGGEGTEDNAGESSNEEKRSVFDELGDSVGKLGDSVGKLANKTVESIKHTIDKSLSSRNTVLTIRVTDEANKKLSMLVDAGIFKSRSESAAYLIEEGIKHQDRLFQKMTDKLNTIEKLRDELKDIVSGEMNDQ